MNAKENAFLEAHLEIGIYIDFVKFTDINFKSRFVLKTSKTSLAI
jgi:hypothetical protein